jgi:hypothetical protein
MNYLLCAILLMAGVAPVHGAMKIWTADPMTRITTDATPPATPTGPMRIVAPRNAVGSGQVIIHGDMPLRALQVSVSAFSSDSGATIPAAAAQIRYAVAATDLSPGAAPAERPRAWFDALSEAFVAGATIQPVWLTVRVPASAAPGEYNGRLTLNGQPVAVRLKVSAFTVPAAEQRVMWVSTTQSPETVALKYGVPAYSEAHWKLLERSLELQGQLADKVLYVPVIAKTWFGNEQGMIRFRRQGNRLTPDFTVLERYLALYRKYCGPPRAVILNVWEPYMVEGERRPHHDKVWLTVLNAAGQPETVEMERYPAHRELWQAVVAGAAAVVQRAGLPPTVLRLGIGSDANVQEQVVDFFRELAPEMTWAVFTHGYGGPPRYLPWTYGEFPDNTVEIKPLRGGWNANPNQIVMNTVRDRHNDASLPVVFRAIADVSVGVHRNRRSFGLARVGLDLWPLGEGGRGGRLIGRFPENRTNRLYRHATYAMTVPGPHGALATQRFEMLREGIQDAEARIRLEQALQADTLPAELKSRVEKLLVDRAELLRDMREKIPPDNGYGLIEQLLDMAGHVQQLTAP